MVDNGGFPLWAAIKWLRSSLCTPAVHHMASWRLSTSVWSYSHPFTCSFLFLLLPVLHTIFKCVSGVILLVATLVPSQWTNWSLRQCCVLAGGNVDEVPVVWLDWDPLPPGWSVCGVITCCRGKGEKDDNEKKWEVLANKLFASSRNRMSDSQLPYSTQVEAFCLYLQAAQDAHSPVIRSMSVRCCLFISRDSLWWMVAGISIVIHSSTERMSDDVCLKASPGSYIKHTLTFKSCYMVSITIPNDVTVNTLSLLCSSWSNVPTLT